MSLLRGKCIQDAMERTLFDHFTKNVRVPCTNGKMSTVNDLQSVLEVSSEINTQGWTKVGYSYLCGR